MNIRARTSIAVLITLSSALLATQYASAQSPSGEESILPEECCAPSVQVDDFWLTLKGAMEAIEANNEAKFCEYVNFPVLRENLKGRISFYSVDRLVECADL